MFSFGNNQLILNDLQSKSKNETAVQIPANHSFVFG